MNKKEIIQTVLGLIAIVKDIKVDRDREECRKLEQNIKELDQKNKILDELLFDLIMIVFIIYFRPKERGDNNDPEKNRRNRKTDGGGGEGEDSP